MYPVGVSSRKTIPRQNLKKIQKYGLTWDGYEFTGVVDKRTLKRLQTFCQTHGYKFKIKNALGERRADYRRTFFQNVPPYFGDYYICAYCGKWLKEPEVTVDHLYPIGKVSESIRLQKKLIKKGIKNINDVRNLVPACEPCNKAKGKKVGKWIRRGQIGRYKWLWIARYILRVIIILGGATLAVLYLTGTLTL